MIYLLAAGQSQRFGKKPKLLQGQPSLLLMSMRKHSRGVCLTHLPAPDLDGWSVVHPEDSSSVCATLLSGLKKSPPSGRVTVHLADVVWNEDDYLRFTEADQGTVWASGTCFGRDELFAASWDAKDTPAVVARLRQEHTSPRWSKPYLLPVFYDMGTPVECYSTFDVDYSSDMPASVTCGPR